MKLIVSIIFFILFCSTAFSQFIEIRCTQNEKIIPKWWNSCKSCPSSLIDGDIIYAVVPSIKLFKVLYPSGSCRGSISDSSYRIIENEFPEFQLTKQEKNYAEFKLDDIIVTMKTKRIKGSIQSDAFEGLHESAENGCIREYGGYQPKNPSTYEYVIIKSKNFLITLPKEAFNNFVQPNIEYCKCYFNKEKSRLYILGFDGDGGETLHFLWLVENGKYIGRTLFGGN